MQGDYQDQRLPVVLLTGATGQVGVFVVPRLLDAGYRVIAVSRKAGRGLALKGGKAADGLHWVHPDDCLESLPGHIVAGLPTGLADVEVLLSCGPVRLAARLLPRCARLRRVVCISTSSVFTKSDSADAAERQVIGEISAAEAELKRLCQARGITLALLRPTLIYGCGLDHNISRMAGLIRRFRFMPVAGKAVGLRQPVHADDLATLALAIFQRHSMDSMETPVGGGSVVSYREMVERIFTGLGLTPRIVSMPPGLLALLARAWSLLPGAGHLNAGFVRRQNQDMVFDDARLREQFDFNPRPFQPTAADFQLPESARSFQRS